jgi:imidazole glycerol phosphate synthase subunit HisF
MLTKRIIPCFDVKDGRAVKSITFLNSTWILANLPAG